MAKSKNMQRISLQTFSNNSRNCLKMQQMQTLAGLKIM